MELNPGKTKSSRECLSVYKIHLEPILLVWHVAELRASKQDGLKRVLLVFQAEASKEKMHKPQEMNNTDHMAQEHYYQNFYLCLLFT